jgi:deoxyadenosine/deoxycytidine kinase
LNNYVVIEGIIGAGKTSLSQLLAQRWNAQLVLEEFAENPFLPKFYEDSKRYAFPLELSFLSERFAQQKQVFQTGNLFQPKVVADYFLPKCQIFAKNNLEEEEYKLFMRLFDIMQQNVPKPDLLVYLHLSPEQALRNIQKRGRSYEQKITSEYLDQIQRNYLSFIQQHADIHVLMIQTDSLDFVNNSSDLEWLISQIEQERPRGIYRVDSKD